MSTREEQMGLGLEPVLRTPRALIPLRSFHVSSPRTTVQEAYDGERRAAGQEAIILAFFRVYEGNWTPSEVCNRVNRGRLAPWPLTSVRRALTNLTKRGLLRRTNLRSIGPLGSPEHAWSLAE